MSRTFGNHLLKRFIVADREIQVPLDVHKICIPSIAMGEIRQNPCNVVFDVICALDHNWRQFTYLETYCQDLEIDGDVEFLILASDRLWDVVPNEVSIPYTKFGTHIHFIFFLSNIPVVLSLKKKQLHMQY